MATSDQQIDVVLDLFNHLIQDRRVLTNRHDNQISEYKARLTLTDGSLLEFSEINVLGIQKRKYAFQWMTASFDLLMRWDNALHHRHISTFPHHKHVGDELTIEPSEEMFLEDVLALIDNQLLRQ
ncbi:toxin-antitoxin system TumE family protein [Spirosoma linguale]|uniref:Uncharacterized protein n=1 Tax=Spirosoma linguale (strain ATCC 33905 / DSM 74 / LMG 10896 / Claus 1) TaxID=504472 RepID=D2QTT9_SPILD|nr:hypothetical protein Slin_6262 [Spirosoma linguale DSM 74]